MIDNVSLLFMKIRVNVGWSFFRVVKNVGGRNAHHEAHWPHG